SLVQAIYEPDRELGRRAAHRLVFGRRESAPSQLAAKDLPPEGDAGGRLFLLHPLPDLVAGPGGSHVIQPVTAGPGLRPGNDGHGIAVLERAVQRRDASVDFGAMAAEADLGVNRER